MSKENQPSFEQAMTRLDELVTAMERGEMTLEHSLKGFEEGMALVKGCRAQLDDIELRVKNMLENQESGA